MTDSSTATPPHRTSPTIELSYESTVPRRLVHRAAVAGVLLTDWRPTGVDSFACAAQWPRSQTVPRGGRRDFDPLLIAETIRQSGILLAHRGYGIPQGHCFLMRRLRFSGAPERMRAFGRPLDLLVQVSVSEIQRRARAVTGLRIDTLLWAGGIRIAEGAGWLRCVDPGVYRRLRHAAIPGGPGLPPPVTAIPAARVGRHAPDDVVLGPPDEDGRHPLRVPLDHPLFFDHPLDHVPGMLAIEAVRQAAVAAVDVPGAALAGADAHFDGFLELDRRCTVLPRVVTDRDGQWEVLVDIEQDRRCVVRGSALLSPP